MKHLKAYEQLDKENGPQVGDYVICKEEQLSSTIISKKIQEFVNNNIAKVVEIQSYTYLIQFFDVPEELKNYITYDDKEKQIDGGRRVYPYEIAEFAPTIEVLKIKQTLNKYNL